MNLNRIKRAIAFTQIALLAAAGSAIAATAKVYVADEGANAVSVIDAASFKISESSGGVNRPRSSGRRIS